MGFSLPFSKDERDAKPTSGEFTEAMSHRLSTKEGVKAMQERGSPV